MNGSCNLFAGRQAQILVPSAVSAPDFVLHNVGPFFLCYPKNDEAQEHLEANVSDEAQWYGRGGLSDYGAVTRARAALAKVSA